jgi:hypothetical protein
MMFAINLTWEERLPILCMHRLIQRGMTTPCNKIMCKNEELDDVKHNLRENK